MPVEMYPLTAFFLDKSIGIMWNYDKIYIKIM